MQWVRFFYDRVFFPVVTTPYFYLLMLCALAVSLCANYLFFSYVAKSRMKSIQVLFTRDIIKAVLLSMLVAAVVIALYDLCLYLSITSEFFRVHRQAFAKLGAFGVEGGFCCQSIQGQSWSLLQRIMTLLFLICLPFTCIAFVEQSVYHLQDSKIWWRYVVMMMFVSIVSYGMVWVIGFV